MASRLAAASVLAGSVAAAWLAVSSLLAARVLQAIILVSIGYVAYLAWHGWREMRAALRHGASGAGTSTGEAGDLPFVSLVVPARDEAPVIAAVARSLAAQRYHSAGTPRFEVIVVDDGSGDGTGEIARAAAEGAPAPVRVTRREPGSGPATRGAALNHATPFARGSVIVAIDADATVGSDFLERSMRAWQRDPRAAGLQALKRPVNVAVDGLTRAQGEELLMDMASQCGRWKTDGTAEFRGNGMCIRRDVLERVGGWGQDVLTEDLDMSTRLAAAGERITLAPEAAVGEEAVERAGPLWHQRMRWAEGSMRRLMEHGPGLLGGGLAIGRKLDFLAWLSEFLVPPLFVASTLAALVTIVLPQPADWTVPASLAIGYGIGTFFLALAGLAADGERGWRLVGRSVHGTLFLTHWLLVVPAALLKIAFGSGRIRYVKTPRLDSDGS
ncbi:MAG: glycosyltransferase family 2 protein [Chloroflexota bacterium]